MNPLILQQIPEAKFISVKKQIGLILATELLEQHALGTFSTLPDVFIDRTVPADSVDEIYLNVLLAGGNYGEITQRDAQGRIIYYLDFYSSAVETEAYSGSTISSETLQKYLSIAMYIFRTPYYRTMGLPPGFIGGVYVENFALLDPHQKEDLDFTRFGRVQLAVRIQEDTEASQGVPFYLDDTTIKLNETEKGYKFVYDITP